MAMFDLSGNQPTATGSTGRFGSLRDEEAYRKKLERQSRRRQEPKKKRKEEDTRGLFSKVYDQLNIADSGRSFKTATPSKKEAQKNIISQLGDTVGASYKRTGEAVGETINQFVSGDQQQREFQQGQSVLQSVIDRADQRLKDPNLDARTRSRIKKLREETIKSRDRLFGQRSGRLTDVIEKTDPVKGAAAIGSIGFDIATLGTGAKAAQAGASGLARNVASAAGQGAVSGGLGAVEQRGSNVGVADIARGAGIGAAVGGGLTAAAGGVSDVLSRRAADRANTISGVAGDVPVGGQKLLETGAPTKQTTTGGATFGGTLPSQADINRLKTVQAKINKAQRAGGLTADEGRALLRERTELIERIQNPVAKNQVALATVNDQLVDAQNAGATRQIADLTQQSKYLAEQVDNTANQLSSEQVLTPTGGVNPLPGNQRAAGQAVSTQARAIDRKLMSQGLEDIQTYGSTTWSTQGEAAAKIIDANPEAAIRIAMGQQEPPEGVLVNAVFKAVEDKAIKEGNVDLIERLVTSSNSAARTSRYAQELGVLGAKDPDSPVTALESIIKSRRDARPDLPATISKEEAGRVTDLAKKLEKEKQLVLDGKGDKAAYGKAKVEFDNYVAERIASVKPKLAEEIKKASFYRRTASKAAGFTKSMVATLDNSVIGRQGWKTLMTSPKTWAKNSLKSFEDMVRTYKGKEVLDEVHANVVSRDNALNGMYKEMGLDVYGAKKNFNEEAFPVSFADVKGKIKSTKVGKLIPNREGKLSFRPLKSSEVAFSAWQQRTRADLADQYLEIAAKQGVDLTDKKQLKAIGRMVNSLTSRGELPKNMERAAEGFNRVFFAPRLVKSHIDVLGGHIITGAGGSNFVRKQAAKNLLKISVGSALALQLASAATGGKIETDPRSSNFGKLQVGDTRFDFTGGMAGLLTLGFRVLPVIPGVPGDPSTKSSVTGEVKPLNSGEYGAKTTLDVLLDFTENKLSPVARTLVDQLEGKNFEGEKPTPQNVAKSLTIPLIVQNYGDLKKTRNPANTAAVMIAEYLGLSTNTYGLSSNWNANNSKRVNGFKSKVSKEKFEKANEDFNRQFADWYDKVSANKKFWALPMDKRESLVTSKKNSLTDSVLKDYGYEYKQQRSSSRQLETINELKGL